MNKSRIARIAQLEKGIKYLRKLNESDTLRQEIRLRNTNMVYNYMEEIYEDIYEEAESIGRPLNYISMDYLGLEMILN